ncbi:MAG TPA: thiamine phosphate synthase [Legionella sp.]|nr:thiamine phosphate synthase [Legionella sp.]
MINKNLQLCLVTHIPDTSIEVYQQFILDAIAGGVTLIQLREKKASLTDIYAFAIALKALITPFSIPLIINDHVAIAKAVDATGVHLGQTDINPLEARAILGPDKWIGLSVETLEDLAVSNQLTCIDYIGASAVFPSHTKPDCKTIWGIEGLKHISTHSTHPVVAIGGISQQNIQQTMACGVSGVAVIGAIYDQPNARIAAMELTREIQRKPHV